MAHRVLIIDDDRWIALSTRMVLEAEGFEVEVCSLPARSLDVARSWQPHLILLDIMMPGYNGWELLACLQADPDICRVPVTVFTARQEPRGRSRALAAGAAEYVRKPYRPEALIKVLNRQLVARAGGAPRS